MIIMKRLFLILAFLSLVYNGFSQVRIPDYPYTYTFEEGYTKLHDLNPNFDKEKTIVMRHKFDDGTEAAVIVFSDESRNFVGVATMLKRYNYGNKTWQFEICDYSSSHQLKDRKIAKFERNISDNSYRVYLDNDAYLSYQFDAISIFTNKRYKIIYRDSEYSKNRNFGNINF